MVATYETLKQEKEDIFNFSRIWKYLNLTSAPAQEDEVKEPDWEVEGKAREDGYTVTEPEQHPYSVLLVMSFGNFDASSVCSGALLTDAWVLTAAHCLVYSKRRYELAFAIVYAGGNSIRELQDKQLPDGAQVLRSDLTLPHPRYAGGSSDHDIALVKTSSGFALTRFVNTVPLFTQPWPNRKFLSCSVTGFGNVQRDTDSEDGFRKTHRLVVGKPCTCQSKIRRLFGKQTRRVLCSKLKKDVGVCEGDSGGALVCGGRVKAVAISIMGVHPRSCRMIPSSRLKCGSKNTLSIFLDTCPYLRWINDSVHLFREGEISAKCVDRAVGVEPALVLLLGATALGQLYSWSTVFLS